MVLPAERIAAVISSNTGLIFLSPLIEMSGGISVFVCVSFRCCDYNVPFAILCLNIQKMRCL